MAELSAEDITDLILKQLTEARLGAGLSQTVVAERFNTSQGMLSHYETGRHLPTLTSLVRWTQALGLRVVLVKEGKSPASSGEPPVTPPEGTPVGDTQKEVPPPASMTQLFSHVE
jgi:transcriptional regulator with XRE-family HTH domain